MKKFFKIYVMLFSVLLLVNNSVIALEFKHEADKAEWIKNFFKDKEAVPSNYADEITKEEIKSREQLIGDFVTQNGIEHVEPIAVGKINDPEIAKFNTACPDKKPINFYKCGYSVGRIETYQIPKEELDDQELAFLIDEHKCSEDSSLKIYKFNVFNTPDNKQDYVLYCDYFVLLRSHGTIFDESTRTRGIYDIKAAYLKFNPRKCEYTDWVGFHTLYPKKKNFVTGIFKYKAKYYFYNTQTYKFTGDKKEKTSLMICGGGIKGSYCCGKDYYDKN
jgi:hypothetical protein